MPKYQHLLLSSVASTVCPSCLHSSGEQQLEDEESIAMQKLMGFSKFDTTKVCCY
jgi:hypothetical protein